MLGSSSAHLSQYHLTLHEEKDSISFNQLRRFMKLSLSAFLIGCFFNLAAFAQLSCTETCQYFDNFNKVCNYKTSCHFVSENCVTAVRCSQWDNFNRTCLYESKTTQCHTPNPYIPAPSCEINCQYWDNFNHTCLYETECEYIAPNCVASTRCEKWDNFNSFCMAAQKTYFCP